MLIPFGVFSAAGAGGGAAAGSYELISTTILGSSSASVTFDVTGLGSTYKHLQLRIAARTDRSSYVDTAMIRFNGSTTNYGSHYMSGNGSSVGSSAEIGQTKIWGTRITAANAGTSVYGGGYLDILDAFSASKYKTTRSLSGYTSGSGSEVYLFSGLWMDITTISSVNLTPNIGSNFVSGSRISLYGIKG